MAKTKLIILLCVLVIVLMICTPLAVIWALNILFKWGLLYNLKTWFATLILCSIFGGSKIVSRN